MASRESSDENWALAVARAHERTDVAVSPGRLKALVSAWAATMSVACVVGLVALGRRSSYDDALGLLGIGVLVVGFVIGGATFWASWRWGLIRWRWQGALRSLTWREQRAVLRSVRSQDVSRDQDELAVARAGAGDLRATSVSNLCVMSSGLATVASLMAGGGAGDLLPLAVAAAMGGVVVISSVELGRAERFLRATRPSDRAAPQ